MFNDVMLKKVYLFLVFCALYFCCIITKGGYDGIFN